MHNRLRLTFVHLVAVQIALVAAADTIPVTGADDPAVDRPAIQAAVDSAEPGDTVELAGVFQLDGTRVLIDLSRLTLAGVELDDDDDGTVNEDWTDGLDNDGDGAIDEDGWDAVVMGVADETGEPILVEGTNALFNRAFVVEGATGTLEHLTIRGIRFSTNHRAIELLPEWGSPTGGCDDRFLTSGSLRHATIERNRFDNNELASLALGAIEHLTVRDNVYTGNGLGSLFVEGTEVDCPLVDGSAVPLAIGTPRFTRLRSNRFVEGGSIALASFETRNIHVKDNRFEGGILGAALIRDEIAVVRDNAFTGVSVGLSADGVEFGLLTGNVIDALFSGVEIGGGRNVLVADNRIVNAFFGLDATGDAKRVLLFDNTIEGAFIGAIFEFGANGFLAVDNVFTGSLIVDVSLDFDTFENRIVNRLPTPITAEDFGTDNQLIGNIEQF